MSLLGMVGIRFAQARRKSVMPVETGIQVTDPSVIPLENGIQVTIRRE